jgi:hypothetical protein
VVRFQSPIEKIALESRGAMVPSHRICCRAPRPILTACSNRTAPRRPLAALEAGVVTFAATNLGAPALGAGIISRREPRLALNTGWVTAEVPANGRLVRRDAEVTTSPSLSSYVAGENRQAD